MNKLLDKLDRREFLKLAGLAGASVILPGQSAKVLGRAEAQPDSGSGTIPAMVIDVGRCIGCGQCVRACSNENNTSADLQRIRTFEMDLGKADTPKDVFHGYAKVRKDSSNLPAGISPWEWNTQQGRWFLPMQCMHCENPPCVEACPTGASYISDDGRVMIDYDKCIGDLICVKACPYGARVLNAAKPETSSALDAPFEREGPLELCDIVEGKPRVRESDVPLRQVGKVEKCTFCEHRTQDGFRPACVVACPVRARHFGDLNDPNSEVSKLLKTGRCFQLVANLDTGPRVYYYFSGA
ncbi:MAG: 4Fe-4S dicluster domain-containing protein [Methanocellales archaeon]|nr:4Fe-4S dicluster domain-containing protein [Methanocellales archaeon]